MTDRTDLKLQSERLEEVERDQRDLFLRAHQLLRRVECPEAADLVAAIDRHLETRGLEYGWAKSLLDEVGGRENDH